MGTLIAIDPGKKTGFVVFVDGRLDDTGVEFVKSYEEFASKLRKLGRSYYLDRLIVELPMIYPIGKWKGNPNDLVSVAFTAGMCAMAFVSDKIELVTPRTWKGTVPKKIMLARIEATLQPGERKVLCRVDKKTDREHAIDAIGLGLWALGRI